MTAPKKTEAKKTTAKKAAAPKRQRGRPCLYTPALADEIIERISSGEPLAQICRDDHVPALRTVHLWRETRADFAARFAHARDDGYDAIAADCLHIANTPLEGEETTIKVDGSIEVKRGDMLGHRKLQIDTRLKLLAKWDPKRYGEYRGLGEEAAAGVVLFVKDMTGRKD